MFNRNASKPARVLKKHCRFAWPKRPLKITRFSVPASEFRDRGGHHLSSIDEGVEPSGLDGLEKVSIGIAMLRRQC